MQGCRVKHLFCFLLMLVCVASTHSVHAQDLAAIGSGPPVTVDGSVTMQSTVYESSDIAARREPLTWLLSGNVTFDVYDVAIPLSFSISDRGQDFSQPFNQYGLSPHYKWATLHLGHRNLRFSRYTLAGHQIFGAGLELTPGILRFAAIAGQFNEAVPEDTTTALLQTPSYERSGYSVKLGVGSGQNFVDLVYLYAQDDTNSLETVSEESLLQAGENAVFGINTRVQPLDGLTIHGDAGLSAYTRNVRSISLADETPELEQVNSIIEPRISTQIYSAFNVGARYTHQRFGVRLDYTRVDPDYQSMGAYFLASDIERLTFAPSLVLLSNTLRLNGSLSWQHDNLQDKKFATTTRLAPTFNISYNPTPVWGVDLQYNDMLTSQEDGTIALNDTTRMDQSAPSVTLTPRLMLRDSLKVQTIVATLLYSRMIDNNDFTAQFTRYESTNLSLAYSLTFIREALSFSANVSGNRLDNLSGRITSISYSLGAEKSFADPAIAVSATFAGSSRQLGSTANFTLGLGYRPAEQHSINLSSSFSTASFDAGNSSFSEFMTTARYVLSF